MTNRNRYRLSFKVYVVQHTEITMVNAQFSKFVASLETREGCPITPGAAFSKQFYLVPLASSNKDRRGIALDGWLKVGKTVTAQPCARIMIVALFAGRRRQFGVVHVDSGWPRPERSDRYCHFVFGAG